MHLTCQRPSAPPQNRRSSPPAGPGGRRIRGGLRPLPPTPKKVDRRSPRRQHEDRAQKEELSLVTPVRIIAGKNCSGMCAITPSVPKISLLIPSFSRDFSLRVLCKRKIIDIIRKDLHRTLSVRRLLVFQRFISCSYRPIWCSSSQK